MGEGLGGFREGQKKRGQPFGYPLHKSASTYSPTFAVPSALSGLTSLFGMGRGGAPTLLTPEYARLSPRISDISGTNLKSFHRKVHGLLVLLGFDIAAFTPATYQRSSLLRPLRDISS